MPQPAVACALFYEPAALVGCANRRCLVMSAPSLLLEVPSAVIPFEKNYLLNPAYRAMGSLHIGNPQVFSFDTRLLRRQT